MCVASTHTRTSESYIKNNKNEIEGNNNNFFIFFYVTKTKYTKHRNKEEKCNSFCPVVHEISN